MRLSYNNEFTSWSYCTYFYLPTVFIFNFRALIARCRGGDYKTIIKKALMGCIVITNYNKKTYRIDDVDFDQNAMSSFTKKDGSSITYWQYYESVWKEKIGGSIRDRQQPLLVSTPKDRDKRRGDVHNIMLLPEICHMTGLTDEMRTDYKIMEALSEHTRKAPTPRVREIQRFLTAVNQVPACKQVMKDWEMELDTNLIPLQARTQNPVKIQIGNNKEHIYQSYSADWSEAYKTVKGQAAGMLEPAHISKWLFVYPKSMYDNVDSMTREFRFVTGGLGVRMDEPEWLEIVSTYSMLSKWSDIL